VVTDACAADAHPASGSSTTAKISNARRNRAFWIAHLPVRPSTRFPGAPAPESGCRGGSPPPSLMGSQTRERARNRSRSLHQAVGVCCGGVVTHHGDPVDGTGHQVRYSGRSEEYPAGCGPTWDWSPTDRRSTRCGATCPCDGRLRGPQVRSTSGSLSTFPPTDPDPSSRLEDRGEWAGHPILPGEPPAGAARTTHSDSSSTSAAAACLVKGSADRWSLAAVWRAGLCPSCAGRSA
jgi:hypothetical protein